MPLFYHICLVKHFYGKGNLNCIIYGLYYHLGLNIIKTCIPSFKILFTHSEYLKIGFFTPTHFWKKTECMDIPSMKPFTKILNFMAPGWVEGSLVLEKYIPVVELLYTFEKFLLFSHIYLPEYDVHKFHHLICEIHDPWNRGHALMQGQYSKNY